MMNEAHNGLLRSIRTRRVGERILPAAHAAGVRHLTMEALNPDFANEANATREVPPAAHGYLAQPEMRSLIGAALGLGWTLIAYEADFSRKPPSVTPHSPEETDWREEQQARNLTEALTRLPSRARLLVWSGNHHFGKREIGGWRPMGLRFREFSGVEHFSIDQAIGVEFDGRESCFAPWVRAYTAEISQSDGAAGFLAEEAPDDWRFVHGGEDAFILSLDNRLS
jgi:hypothetical protein